MSRYWALLSCSLIFISCGGESEESLPGGTSGGSTSNAGGALGGGGGGGGGSESTGGGDFGANAGSGGASTTGGRSSDSGGAGGVRAAPSGGTSSGGTVGEDLGNSYCKDDYVELPAGPLAEGPENPNVSCSLIADEAILEAYEKAKEQKTLQGYYYDPANMVIWGESCSDSLTDTESWANQEVSADSELSGSSSTDYFYEVAYCEGFENSSRRRYRQLRCDYYDGERFAGPLPPNRDAPGFLASLLWFNEFRSLHGSQLISTTSISGSAFDATTLCTIETVYGDFGLCDAITLKAQQVSIYVGGSLTIGESEAIRTIEGQCQPVDG